MKFLIIQFLPDCYYFPNFSEHLTNILDLCLKIVLCATFHSTKSVIIVQRAFWINFHNISPHAYSIRFHELSRHFAAMSTRAPLVTTAALTSLLPYATKMSKLFLPMVFHLYTPFSFCWNIFNISDNLFRPSYNSIGL
jgi:hypothetical protein